MANELAAEPEHLELVALDPRELSQAQTDLVAWCRRKIGQLINDRADAEERIRVTTGSALYTDAFTRQVNKAKREIEYHQKLIAALQAGYLIVPNLPLRVFAVRTKRVQPSGQAYQSWQVPDVPAQVLAQGEGRYVAPQPAVASAPGQRKDLEGKLVPATIWSASDFQEVSFPARLVKPAVLDATQRALALKLFDEIGLVAERDQGVPDRRDPIVAGRIRHPGWRAWAHREATFFIAWWFNTRSL